MSIFSSCLTFFLAVVSAITFGIDLWVNYETSTNNNNKMRQISNDHEIQTRPANWIFTIWTVIYALFVVWYIYVFLLLIRQICVGRNKLPLFPGLFWFIFIIINVLNGLWVRLYIKGYMLLTGIIIAVLTLMLYLINIIAFRVCWFDVTYNKSYNDDNDVEKDNDDMIELSRCEVILLRLTTLNGLPIYATWCTIATALQWTMIFQYYTFHWSSNISSIVTLSILSFILLIFWFTEIISNLRKYLVYTWLPAITLIVAFSSIIARARSVGDSNHPGLTFVFVLLITSVAMVMLKLLSLCLWPPNCGCQRDSHVSRV